MSQIFTLDARGNFLLKLFQDHFELSNQQMRQEITRLHDQTTSILKKKGIDYKKLKNALIPIHNRNEIALIFETQKIGSNWYGLEVAKMYIPLLEKKTTQSILCGDLIGRDQQLIKSILDIFLNKSREYTFIHGTGFYCIYINNLSDQMIQNIHEGLKEYDSYVGFIDTTHSNIAKTYLSISLVNCFLKFGNQVITGHEDDVPNMENVNMLGYPFEEWGYEYLSMQSHYYDLFLSYKIEREVTKDEQSDIEISLLSVSNQFIPLDECTIYLEEAKHEYLKSKKGKQLSKAQIEDFERVDLEKLIQSKISSNYIYNMEFLSQHDVVKFNILI
jgi:hypothetical protein